MPPKDTEFAQGAASGDRRHESLHKLRSGELSLDEYLDERVEQAVAHLAGRVDSARLEQIRELLREEVRTDPVLVEMVRQATGRTPETRA